MKVLKPETNEVLIIRNSEELRKLFEELKREAENEGNRVWGKEVYSAGE